LQPLPRREQRRSPASLGRTQRPLTAMTCLAEPFVDGCPAKAIALDDRARRLATAHAPNRHFANGFARLVIQRAAVDSNNQQTITKSCCCVV
jgi:hypothetical protein